MKLQRYYFYGLQVSKIFIDIESCDKFKNTQEDIFSILIISFTNNPFIHGQIYDLYNRWVLFRFALQTIPSSFKH